MERYVPDIQERLRREYPLFQQAQIHEVGINMASPGQPEVRQSVRWSFLNAEKDRGVVLAPDGVVLETTDYDTFDEFMRQLGEILEVIGSTAQISIAERIGLRYVNLVRSDSRDAVRNQLQAGIRGLDLAQVELAGRRSRYEVQGDTQVGHLIVRVTESEGSFQLPPDLQPMDLQIRRNDMGDPTPYATLDLDHFSVSQRPFRSELLSSALWSLHDTLDQSFRAAVTPSALQAWVAEQR